MSSPAEPTPPPPRSTTDRILDAGLLVFSRYGFRRTGMALVAEQAGISRPALYLHFPNKAELFRAVAQRLVDTACHDMATCWSDTAGLADNLTSIILARDLPLFRLQKLTPHGAELMEIDAELTANAARALSTGFRDQLQQAADRLAAQGRLDLSAYGDAAAFAAQVSILAVGLKHESASETDYVAAVTALARLFERAQS